MPQKKPKKTFFKIKEKQVFVTPKKFLVRRFFGVVCVFIGTLILAFSITVFYIIPKFFPSKTKIVEVLPPEQEFIPQRILIPTFNVSLAIDKSHLDGNVPQTLSKIKAGDELIIFGSREYQRYLVSGTQVNPASESAGLRFEGNSISLILILPNKPEKNILIKADLVQE